MSLIERTDFYAITAALLWGLNYVVVKSVLNTVPENLFLLVRFTATVFIIGLFLILRRKPIKLRRRDLPKILLLGVVGVGLYNILWTFGIHRTTAANAGLIISTSPFFAQLYQQLVQKEKAGWRRWFFILLAFWGIFLIIGQSPGSRFDFSSQTLLGNVVTLGGALLFTFYTVYAKPLLQNYSAFELNGLTMAAGLPVLVLYCLVAGPLMIPKLTYSIVWEMAYVVGFGTIAAFVCWYAGVKHCGPIKVILFHSLVPIASLALGYLFLHEPVNLVQIGGGILAFTGIIAAKSGK